MQITSRAHQQEINWLHVAPLVLYFLFSPIYLFHSGLPQIADIIIALGISGLCFHAITALQLKIRFIFFLALGFALYTVCINLINYIYFPHTRFLLTSLYYPYNILIFVYVVKMFEKYGSSLYKIILFALSCTVVAELIWAILMPQDHWREIGSFNNPNQLAYWSLLTAVMIVLLKQHKPLGLIEMGLLAALGFLQTLALSKAGLISYSIFLIIVFCSPLITKTSRLAITSIFILSIPIGFIFVSHANVNIGFIERSVDRLLNIGEEPDDSAQARGYNRPLDFPAYIILGAGEGAYDRFEPDNSIELHSAIVTIFFSYGIIGIILFIALIFQVANKKPLYIILLFVPVLMFGITGQSFRFSHFWIFLAFAYLSGIPKKENGERLYSDLTSTKT